MRYFGKAKAKVDTKRAIIPPSNILTSDGNMESLQKLVNEGTKTVVLNIVSKPGLSENLQIKSLALKHSEVFDLVIVPRDKA